MSDFSNALRMVTAAALAPGLAFAGSNSGAAAAHQWRADGCRFRWAAIDSVEPRSVRPPSNSDVNALYQWWRTNG